MMANVRAAKAAAKRAKSTRAIDMSKVRGKRGNKKPRREAEVDASMPSLYDAIVDGIVDVEKYLDAGIDVNEALTSDGATPLLLAAQNGHLDVVRKLIAADADVDKAATNGCTPLYITAAKGHIAVARKLIDAGAHDLRVHGAMMCDIMFAGKKRIATPNWIFQDITGPSLGCDTHSSLPLLIAAHYGNLAVVTKLIAAGAVVDEAATNGSTPLFFAASSGHAAIVSKLLQHGADKSIHNQGETPLMAAQRRNHAAVVALLA